MWVLQGGDRFLLPKKSKSDRFKQLEESNPNATEVEQIAYLEDETTPSFKRRVSGALKAGGESAIDEFILENKHLKVVKEACKVWLQENS